MANETFFEKDVVSTTNTQSPNISDIDTSAFVKKLENYIDKKPIENRDAFKDFLNVDSSSIDFERAKEALETHIDEEKNQEWSYEAELFLSNFFQNHSNLLVDFTNIDCRDSSCEIIGFIEGVDYKTPDSDINLMLVEVDLLKKIEPIMNDLLLRPGYFELLTDSMTPPYFSMPINDGIANIPFVFYLKRSAKSMNLNP